MRSVVVEENAYQQLSGHREGKIEFNRLFRGEAGTPGNFELALTRIGEYSTPRHRHPYDQVRFCYKGSLNYAGAKHMPEGSVLYVPEGAYYGPQDVDNDPLVLTLQFGGASGMGMPTYDELHAAHLALIEEGGEFVGGVYSYTDESGKKHNKDGYEAVWEKFSGRPLRYGTPRYEEPVLMNPEGFEWVPVEGEAGVYEKPLGVFTERKTRVGFLKWDGGASHTVSDGLQAPELHFVTKGTLRRGDEIYAKETALMFEPGDPETVLEAVEETETFVIGMPALAAPAHR